MSRKSNFRLYRVWDGIIQRCYNPYAKNYHNYGGRGIRMLEDWRRDFSAFEEFCLANGWKHGLQVDRIDNERGYFPDNIRFVTCAANLRNKRTNHLITYNGETHCLTDWSKILGIADSTLHRRLDSGWSVEDAFTKPLQPRRKMDGEGNCKEAYIADHLIANGVTVQERGHWDIFDDGYSCELMSCSVCKAEFYDGDNDTVDQPPNYCPHCGAKMLPQPPKGE